MQIRLTNENGRETKLGGLEWVDLPRCIKRPQSGEAGVDLTAYEAIMCYSAHGKDVAIQHHPDKIVAWQHPTSRGHMEGIHFPKGFDASKVRFYRTESQERRARVRALRNAAAAI